MLGHPPSDRPSQRGMPPQWPAVAILMSCRVEAHLRRRHFAGRCRRCVGMAVLAADVHATADNAQDRHATFEHLDALAGIE
jgi:hypothetical protein